MLYPAMPELLSLHVKPTLCDGVTPVPAKVPVGPFVALLTKLNVADVVPDICGAKVRVSRALWPAARVSGKAIPLRRNSELLTDPEVIVTLDPLALIEPDWVDVLPTVTVPKFAEVGVRVNWPCAVPVPDKPIVRFGFEALETIEMLPLALPARVGENDTGNDTLCPGLKVAGRVSPLIENPVPVTLACDRLTLVPPEFVMV
jgi:hypothetical protein